MGGTGNYIFLENPPPPAGGGWTPEKKNPPGGCPPPEIKEGRALPGEGVFKLNRFRSPHCFFWKDFPKNESFLIPITPALGNFPKIFSPPQGFPTSPEWMGDVPWDKMLL